MASLTEHRPKRATPEMMLAAAKRIADQLSENGLIEDSEVDEAARDIAKHGRSYTGGYELAKALDSYCGWDCDLEIATVLDDFSGEVSREIAKAEKAWFAANPVEPPFPAGSRVSIGHGETGIIDCIYEYGVAKYAIAVDGDERAAAPTNCRRIVNFEDVSPL